MANLNTHGALFSCGKAIEIVRPEGQSGLQLLHWDSTVGRICERVEMQGDIYTPDCVDPNFMRALRLPTNPESYGAATALIGNLATTIAKYSGLAETSSRLAAFFIVMTWLVDCGAFAPRFLLVGPTSREAGQLLKLLGAFCRHGLMLTNISPSGFWSLPFQFGVTVILRQPQLSTQMRQALDAATNADHFVSWKGRLVKPFSPVVVHTDSFGGDSAARAGIELAVWPTAKGVPILDHGTEEALAAHFQNRLLNFRLTNFSAVTSSIFDPAELSSPIREIARSLGSCFPNDPDLQNEVVDLLRDADLHTRVQLATDERSLLLECLLVRCHESQGQKNAGVHVGALAEDMLALSAGRSNPIDLKPRAVGELLRDIGLETQRLDRSGRGILLCSQIAGRVHELAMQLRVPTMTQGAQRCALCEEVRQKHAEPWVSVKDGG